MAITGRHGSLRAPLAGSVARAASFAAVAFVGACVIQRPPIPPEFLELRYEVTDSTAAAAVAFLRDEVTAREVLRERLPVLAAQTQVDTLVMRVTGDPELAPLGRALREVVDDAVTGSSGRVRAALSHPDAQRQLVEAVVLGLGLALRRFTEDAPERPR
jgi:hypothetical protein